MVVDIKRSSLEAEGRVADLKLKVWQIRGRPGHASTNGLPLPRIDSRVSVQNPPDQLKKA
jgi:hypothetical protein